MAESKILIKPVHLCMCVVAFSANSHEQTQYISRFVGSLFLRAMFCQTNNVLICFNLDKRYHS